MSKGALNSMQHGLIEPLAAKGIRINTVSPGVTETDMVSIITDSLGAVNKSNSRSAPESWPPPSTRGHSPIDSSQQHDRDIAEKGRNRLTG